MTTTKTEIREYLSRVRRASSALNYWLDNEKRIRAESGDAAYASNLAYWTEELSGCGGEVQNLVEDRYPNTSAHSYTSA